MKRATFKSYGSNHVTLAYDDEGERVIRSFTAPVDGGYVQEILSNGAYRQVCEKLYRRGTTLYFNADKPLIDLIRAEYRAMRAADNL